MSKEQAELARANFSILRKEAQSFLDLVSFVFLPDSFNLEGLYTSKFI